MMIKNEIVEKIILKNVNQHIINDKPQMIAKTYQPRKSKNNTKLNISLEHASGIGNE